jgi:hypothetical protein
VGTVRANCRKETICRRVTGRVRKGRGTLPNKKAWPALGRRGFSLDLWCGLFLLFRACRQVFDTDGHATESSSVAHENPLCIWEGNAVGRHFTRTNLFDTTACESPRGNTDGGKWKPKTTKNSKRRFEYSIRMNQSMMARNSFSFGFFLLPQADNTTYSELL